MPLKSRRNANEYVDGVYSVPRQHPKNNRLLRAFFARLRRAIAYPLASPAYPPENWRICDPCCQPLFVFLPLGLIPAICFLRQLLKNRVEFLVFF